MKTKSITNIFALALILVTLFSCSKYEDGPWISFRSAENRIIGKWKVEYFEVDGVDVTQQWIDNYDWKFEFYYDEYSAVHKGWIEGINCCSDSDTLIAVANLFWNISDDGKTFGFSITSFLSSYIFPPNDTVICGIYPFQTYTSATYTITKLSNRKLWLKHENEEHEYLIKLN